MFASWRVGIILSAMNLTGPGFQALIRHADEANMRIQRLNNSMQYLRMGAAFGLAEAGRVGVSAFIAMGNEAGKYQLTMQLVAQQTNATAEQMKRLDSIVTDLSAGPHRTMFGLNEIGSMARELQQSGINIKRIISPFGPHDNRSLLQEVVYAAEVEKLRNHTSGEASARSFGQIIKGYGLDQDPTKLVKFLNQYTAVASQTHMKATDLGTLETQFGQTARAFNMDPMGMLMLYGFLRQRGFQSSTAATSLSNFMINTIPTFSLNATKTSAKTQALEMMGLLNSGNVGNARKMLQMYESSQKEVFGKGYVDPSRMTAHQQNALANAVLVAVTTGKFGGKGALTGDQVMFALAGAQERFTKMFGPKVGEEIYSSMARQAFNLRGLRAVLALTAGMQPGANGSPSQWHDFNASVRAQMDLDARAAQLRHQYAAMKEMVPQQISTILAKMGGYQFVQTYNPNTKQYETQVVARPGGPLDIAQRVLFKITDMLGKFTAWISAHPDAAAKIGTLIGALGVGMFVGAAVLATSATMELTRALLIYSGAAKAGGLRGFVARLLGATGSGAAVEEAEIAAKSGLLGRVAGAPAAARREFAEYMAHARMGGFNPFYMRYRATRMEDGSIDFVRRNWFQHQGLRFQSGAKGLWAGLAEGSDVGGIFRPIAGFLARVVEFGGPLLRIGFTLGKVIVGLTDVIGWIWLAWTAIDFVIHHAWDVGYWTGMVVKATGAILNWIVNGIKWIFNGFVQLIQGIIHMITHPLDARASWSKFWADFEDGYLKATNPKAWEHKHKNEQTYLHNLNVARHRAEYGTLTHSSSYRSAEHVLHTVHDKRQFNIAWTLGGVNMIDPQVQQDLVHRMSDQILDIVEKDAALHHWSSPAAPGSDPRLWSVSHGGQQGSF